MRRARLWKGDPTHAQGAPDLVFHSEPRWTVITGETPLEANYMMLTEKVLDLTHFGYVHRNSSGPGRSGAVQALLDAEQLADALQQ